MRDSAPWKLAAEGWLGTWDPGLVSMNQELETFIQDWDPRTLKQISAGVLSMGKMVGCLNAAMKTLAEIEIDLQKVRESIGISRKAPPSSLLRVTTLLRRDGEWISPGRWIPSILDAAGAFDPLHASRDSDLKPSMERLSAAHLDQVLLLSAASSADKQLDLAGVIWHRVTRPDIWLTPGPGVFSAVAYAAELIHGIKRKRTRLD